MAIKWELSMSEKKLIIDEDWKSLVQAEKEAAAKQPAGEPAAATGKEAAKPQPAAAHDPADIQMPPASLELLVTTLATEALVALGQVPHPATGELHSHRNQAQYLIDTIDVLRQKTKGNLTPDEERMIESILHQLRMVFLETAGMIPDGEDKPAG
jgi:D-alanyl-D-alanine carboxypeptidase